MPSKTALIVVDMQNDFLEDGKLGVPYSYDIIEPVKTLMARYPNVIMTQDWHPLGHHSFASTHHAPVFSTREMFYGTQTLWPDHCIQGTTGADFVTHLNPDKAQLILRKGWNIEVDSYSAFAENDKTHTGLQSYLRERGFDKIVLCGLALDYCVGYSALDAVHRDFQTTVCLNATRHIAEDSKLAMLTQLQGWGVKLTNA